MPPHRTYLNIRLEVIPMQSLASNSVNCAHILLKIHLHRPARSGSRLTLTPAPYQLQSHQSVQHPAQAPIALPSLCPLPDISLRSDITIAAQSVIAPPAILGEQDDESLSSEPTQITSIQPPVPSFENNPPSFQISESSQRDSPPTRPGSSDGIFATPLLRQSRQPGRSTPNLESSPFVGNQARNHSCPTCNKSFDRPSTLRKHLRVHTGEQPFECGHCGRRFQNTSNLNRHERRCNPKLDTHEENAHAEVVENDPTKSQDAAPSLKKRHRRNRKQENWIPPSLRGFNLIPDEFCVAAPIPLPLAVFGSTSELDGVREERDSSATQAHSNPYSEEGWTGRLPGPASKPRNAEVLTWFPYGNGRPSGTTRAPAPEALKKAGFLQAF
ncbi:hypothetical protein DL96DRAFT_709261 [Flagelloscypha sp. PMI_526]|nr:hypothetical protein DL96DRAFT_709261 [Flagelloscypha sp. PMI_526]